MTEYLNTNNTDSVIKINNPPMNYLSILPIEIIDMILKKNTPTERFEMMKTNNKNMECPSRL